MSARYGRRGIRSILYALYQTPCSTQFSCDPQTFKEKDGAITLITLTDGKVSVEHQKPDMSNLAPIENKETQNSEINDKITANDNSLESNINKEEEEKVEKEDIENIKKKDDDVKESKDTKVKEASDNYNDDQNNNNGNSFDYVTSTNVEGPQYDYSILVVDEKIEGDCPEEQIPRIKAASLHIKNAVSKLYDLPVLSISIHFGILGETLYILADSYCNTSTQTLGDNTDDIEAQFGEFYTEEMKEKVNLAYCYINSPDCDSPNYKAPRSMCLLLKAHKKFPNTSCARLYDLIEPRFESQRDPKVFICVRCWHQISSLDYLAYIEHKETPELKTLSPKDFQPIVPSELFDKRKFPTGLTAGMNKPYSFALNIENSPYKVKSQSVSKPTNGKYTKPNEVTVSQPVLVKRLMSRAATQYKSSRKISRGYIRPTTVNTKLLFYPESGAPLQRVRKNYTNPPFDISLMDPKRKRRIHNANEDFSYRFGSDNNALETSGKKSDDDRPYFFLK